MPVWVWLAVAAFGGCFSVLRFLVGGLVSEATATSAFPWGTFVVNISGSFVLGCLVGAALGGTSLLLAGTASIGSYTTFSAWVFELQRLRGRGGRRALVLYALASLVVGLGATAAGHALGTIV